MSAPTPLPSDDKFLEINVETWRDLNNQLTELRASLRREENARKVLAGDNDRLRAQVQSLTKAPEQPTESFAEKFNAPMDAAARRAGKGERDAQ